MTKLTRLTAKIFGETANATGDDPAIGQFGSGKAGTYIGTGDVATIQSLPAWNNGWVDAVTPSQQFPALPEMTGVHKVLSYQNAYLLQQGIAEWDSATTYYTNNFCAKDGKIYFSKTNSNLNNNPASDTVNWEEFKSGNSRSIGEIITSIVPLTDAGLHLLDGTLINGTGSYSRFVDYIATLVADYPDLFTTEALWQQSVTTYGVCGKFVYDSVNNTLRLPKITGIVEGTTDLTALGDLVQAGLPNITGKFWVGRSAVAAEGAFVKDQTGGEYSNSGNASDGGHYSFDASRSSSIYGNNSTVQPQTIKVLYYIVIATSTKTEIEVDIDEIATDLNGKADVDLTNVTNVGNIKMANASMPSATRIQLTTGASGTAYIAPADGYLFAEGTLTQAGWIIVTNDTFRGYETSVPSTVEGACEWVPIRKGATGYVYYVNASSLTVWFIYAVGSESEAQ